MMDEKEKYEKLRILIVDDESYIRQMITGMLRQIGYQYINEAREGGEGFREVVRLRPQVVLCDVHMEPMDGLAFLAKLRGFVNDTIAATPVVFLTADKQQETVLSAKQLKVDGYLVKPVALALLKQRLDALLKFHHLL